MTIREAPIERLSVSAYRMPTDYPESDGTADWNATTIVLVWAEAALRALDAPARAGTPIVGLEPSCTAVFRHDLGQMFPGHPAAQRVAEATITLGEMLRDHAPDWSPPYVGKRAIVQAHCHHQAVLDFDADLAVLDAAGVGVQRLDSGCCGLAGNFGFERGHHDVSMACAERVMAPAIRQAAPGALVLADGFNCRTQIEHTTDRRALHLAEVRDQALPPAPPHERRL